MRRIGIAVVLAVGIGLGGAQAAWATTTTVNCSELLSALNSAAPGDVVKLNGVCTNQSFEITNTNAFTLEGVGNQTNGTPSSGFTGVDNGSGNAILDSGSAVHLTVKNLIFEDATRSSGGGTAIDFTDSDNIAVTITGNTFTDLHAPGNGGAIQIGDSTNGAGSTKPTVISHNRFENNSSPDGGAIYWADGGPLKLADNTFTGNSQNSTSTFYPVGGAVDLENYEGTTGVTSTWLGSPVTVSGNTFGGTASGAGNSAHAAGGALFISLQGGEGAGEPAQTVTLTNNQFIDNQVTGGVNSDLYGGALGMSPQVRQRAFTVAQANNLFQGNHVTAALGSGYGAGGGAEWGIGLPVKSTGDRFFKNQVSVTGATTVPPLGGALGILSTNQYIGTASSTTLLRASFTGADDLFRGNSDPSANGWGGAIYTGGSSLGVNCPSETACPSSLTLYDSTLVHNKVPVANGGEGAAIWGGPADSLRLENSIVYGNTGPSGTPEIFGYSKPKYAYDDACEALGGKAPLTGKGDICANPKLVPPGMESRHSPTIDKGSNALVPKGLKTDVAGNHRITEGSPRTCKPIVDMGAFEFKAVKPGEICHPANVKPPHISGKPKVGHTLTCVKGSWTNHPRRYRYQWKRNGPAIHGATKSTYKVTSADKGHGLKCTVWAINKYGSSKAAVSAAVHVK